MHKKPLCFLLTAITLISACLLSSCGKTPEDRAYEAQDAVVRVLCIDDSGIATGSGFAIGVPGQESDIFVTNRHVVVKQDDSISDEVYIMLSNDSLVFKYYFVLLTAEEARYYSQKDQTVYNAGDPYPYKSQVDIDENTIVKCKVLKTSADYPDVAIIQAEQKISGITALPRGSAEDLKKGQTVFALGYPGSADESQRTVDYEYVDGREMYVITEVWSASLDEMSITSGTVNKTTEYKRYGDTKVVSHTAHINHGSSGGPLIDKYGNVVGINTYGNTEDDAFAYSVFIEYAEQYLNSLDIYWVDGSSSATSVIVIGAACFGVLIIVAAVVLITVTRIRAVPRAYLLCLSGEFKGLNKPITASPLLIGRSEGCAVQFSNDARGVSRLHCRFQYKNGVITVTDLNSSFGTFVNGNRLTPNVETALKKGDKIQIADSSREFIIN